MHLWNPKFHYHACKTFQLVPFLIQMNLVHTSPSCFLRPTWILFFYLLRFTMWALSFRYSYQNPVCISIFPHICHNLCLSHPSRFDHPKTFYEEYRSWSSVFSSSVSLSTPLAKYFPEHRIFQHPQPVFCLYCVRPKFHTHIKIAGKIICIYVCVCVCVCV